MRKTGFNATMRNEQKKSFNRMLAYQKKYEQQVGKRKTNRRMIRKG